MLPSEDFGLVPKFGMEIEVVQWAGTSRNTIVRNLVAAQHMSKEGKFDAGTHRYHCDCNVCQTWNSGKVPWPVQTVLQYDASLPDDGGEFITSPMLCTELFLDNLYEIWQTVCASAQWRMDIPNRRGGASSPSIHIHVSVENPFKLNFSAEHARRTLWQFMPELFTIASVCGLDRGLEYRSVDPDEGHHAALNICRVQQPTMATTRTTRAAANQRLIQPVGSDNIDNIVSDSSWPPIEGPSSQFQAAPVRQPRGTGSAAIRLEWRMFEAAYSDWPYVKGCIALASALTQLVANKDMANVIYSGVNLMSDEAEHGYSIEECRTTKELLKLFNRKRFYFLTETVLSAPLVAEDPVVYGALTELFERVKVPNGK